MVSAALLVTLAALLLLPSWKIFRHMAAKLALAVLIVFGLKTFCNADLSVPPYLTEGQACVPGLATGDGCGAHDQHEDGWGSLEHAFTLGPPMLLQQNVATQQWAQPPNVTIPIHRHEFVQADAWDGSRQCYFYGTWGGERWVLFG